MRSIGRQLGVGLAAILLLVGLVIAQLALSQFDRALRTLAERELTLAAERTFAAIERGPEGPLLDVTRLDAVYQQPQSGHYFVVRVDGQTWRSRSLWDDDLTVPARAGLASELVPGPAAQRLLVLRADFRRYGRDLSIVVANDLAPAREQFARTVRWLMAVWGIGLFALVLLQRWWVRRALRPLAEARDQIEQLRAGARARLDETSARELAPLLGEINLLLDRTRHSVERSRNALGNLGHALKTPLAVIGTLAERESVRADEDVHRQLTTQVDVMRRRIGRVLGQARAAGETHGVLPFDLRADVSFLVESVRRARDRELAVDVVVDVEDALPFDRDDVLELIGNLLDNACKWARERVFLQIRRQAGHLEIVVEDDGPGIAHAEQARVLERGVRLDERADGHGLGLAIVRDIVDVYGGSIVLSRSALGGLCVLATLPWPGAG